MPAEVTLTNIYAYQGGEVARGINPQESLLVVSERTGQIAEHDFSSAEQGAVNRLEQKLHLMNTLGYLSAASMREGLTRAGDGVLSDRYGDEPSKIVQGAERNRVELIKRAKLEFARGTGHFALIDSGAAETREAKQVTRGLFSDFLKKYYGVHHHRENFDYRKQLEGEVSSLTSQAETTVSVFNREHGLRPHRHSRTTDEPDIPVEKLEDLDTRQRLETILFDPRAGFLPKTNDEKNQVLSWLDYLDNPDKPLGINNQLREVFVRAQHPDRKPGRPGKSLGVRFGVRAVESIAWETGDYLLEAANRTQAVRSLRAKLDKDQRPSLSLFDEFCRPVNRAEVSLDEMFEEDAAGLASYVQYLDILEYVEKGQVKGLRGSPLMTTEYPPRSVRPKLDATPGKRKLVLNQYTRPGIADEYRDHIIERLEESTIGTARQQLDGCIEDLVREENFLRRRLAELATFRDGPSQPVQDAVTTIYRQLEQLDAVA